MLDKSYSATLGLRPELAKGRTGLRSHICLTPGTLAHNSQALLSLRIETFHPCEYSKRLVGPLVKGLICIGLWIKKPTDFILFPQRMQLRECGKQKPEAGSGEHLPSDAVERQWMQGMNKAQDRVEVLAL